MYDTKIKNKCLKSKPRTKTYVNKPCISLGLLIVNLINDLVIRV